MQYWVHSQPLLHLFAVLFDLGIIVSEPGSPDSCTQCHCIMCSNKWNYFDRCADMASSVARPK
jgi:hypothetical protein